MSVPAQPLSSWGVNACLRPDDPIDAAAALTERAEEYARESGGEIVDEAIDLAEDAPRPWIQRPAVGRMLDRLRTGVLKLDTLVIVDPRAVLHVDELVVVHDVMGLFEVDLVVDGVGLIAGGRRQLRQLERAALGVE
jgi:hypothetical protein